jgi:hypothetical protein
MELCRNRRVIGTVENFSTQLEPVITSIEMWTGLPNLTLLASSSLFGRSQVWQGLRIRLRVGSRFCAPPDRL